MIEENHNEEGHEEQDVPQDPEGQSSEGQPAEDGEGDDGTGADMEQVIRIKGMYNEYFLDYASYVILERAVPHLHDGLKPVQRRILLLKEMDDGRFHKVANAIGNTMKYHPHGDEHRRCRGADRQRSRARLPGKLGQHPHGRSGRRTALYRDPPEPLRQGGAVQCQDHQLVVQLRWPEPGAGDVARQVPAVAPAGRGGHRRRPRRKMLPHNFNELIDGSVAYLKGRVSNSCRTSRPGERRTVSSTTTAFAEAGFACGPSSAGGQQTLIVEEVPYG